MNEANTPPESDAPPPEPVGRRAGLPARIWPYLRPAVRQSWLNIKVWAPFFANPFEKERCVGYSARESREGLTWKIALPSRCWNCEATEKLLRREYDFAIRGFEYGPSIGLVTIGFAGFILFLSLALFSLKGFILSLLILLAGALTMFLKSWQERVRVFISTCPDHADGLTRPDAAIEDNDLRLYLPTPELARAARVELHAERIRNRPLGQSTSPYVPRGESPPHQQVTPSIRPTPDLPPIKLTPDEDEEDGTED